MREREDGTVGSFKTAECSQQSRYIIHVLAGSAALTRRVVSSHSPPLSKPLASLQRNQYLKYRTHHHVSNKSSTFRLPEL